MRYIYTWNRYTLYNSVCSESYNHSLDIIVVSTQKRGEACGERSTGEIRHFRFPHGFIERIARNLTTFCVVNLLLTEVGNPLSVIKFNVSRIDERFHSISQIRSS